MSADDLLLESLRRRFPVASKVPFNGLDYIHAQGSPLEAWMYSRLFWPSFVEVDGMVFLRDDVEDADDISRVADALSTFKGDKRRTQCSFNTFEVAHLFGLHRPDTTAEQDVCLAEVLAEMWRAKL